MKEGASKEGTPLTPEPLMTVREVAAWLGVSSRTIQRMAALERIPKIELPPASGTARNLRFDRVEVQAWRDSRKAAPRVARTPLPRARAEPSTRMVSPRECSEMWERIGLAGSPSTPMAAKQRRPQSRRPKPKASKPEAKANGP